MFYGRRVDYDDAFGQSIPRYPDGGRDKIAAISQTISSNAFSWMNMYEFKIKISLKIHYQGSNQQHSSTGSEDNGLARTRRQAIIWINDG